MWLPCRWDKHYGTPRLAHALILNATIFVVGISAGPIAQSMGLIADALDMLADSRVYAVALLALKRNARFKATAATLSGGLLLLLGAAALVGVAWRFLQGSEPEAAWMMGIALISLMVNVTSLRLLGRFREGEVHLRAAWLFTRTDVIANVAVIIAGAMVWWLRNAIPDLAIGALVGAYVIKEALGILHEARESREGAHGPATP